MEIEYVTPLNLMTKKHPRARNAFYPDVPEFSLPLTAQTILHLNQKNTVQLV